MVSAGERHRLKKQFESERLDGLGAVLNCAVPLLVLVIFAAGPWAFLFLSAGGSATAERVQSASQANRTVAESKRAFEERRRTYEAARQTEAAKLTQGAGGGLVVRDLVIDAGFDLRANDRPSSVVEAH